MKNKKIIFIGLIIFIVFSVIYVFSFEVKQIPLKEENDYRIVNYNIKYGEISSNLFKERRDLITQQLLSYNPDIITLQEANEAWMDLEEGLPALLKGYSYAGVGREDGRDKGEFAAIFYLTSKFEKIEENTIWLSETPEEVSIGWDASTYRIMTSVTLKDKETREIFTIYNTHLDHEGKKAREESISLILDTISKNDYPYLLTGDMNFPSFYPEYFKVTSKLEDTKNIAKSSMKHGTINYNSNNKLFHFIRIDYIFVKKNNFNITNYRVDPSYKYLNYPISDHFPVIVDFSLKK